MNNLDSINILILLILSAIKNFLEKKGLKIAPTGETLPKKHQDLFYI